MGRTWVHHSAVCGDDCDQCFVCGGAEEGGCTAAEGGVVGPWCVSDVGRFVAFDREMDRHGEQLSVYHLYVSLLGRCGGNVDS